MTPPTIITTTATSMFSYDFMLRAFAASGIVAIVAGTVGYFIVLRGQTFAGHALSHIGFTGATGAALIGVSPLGGLIAFVVAAGVGAERTGSQQRPPRQPGQRTAGRDVVHLPRSPAGSLVGAPPHGVAEVTVGSGS